MTQNEIGKLSIAKAKEIFVSGKIYDIGVDTVAEVQAIHHALFDGLYPFAGKIRKLNFKRVVSDLQTLFISFRLSLSDDCKLLDFHMSDVKCSRHIVTGLLCTTKNYKPSFNNKK